MFVCVVNLRVAKLGCTFFFQKLDYETAENHEYRFKVKAVNVAPPKPAYFHRTMEDETDVIVTVGNINEPPEFTKTDYSFAGNFE